MPTGPMLPPTQKTMWLRPAICRQIWEHSTWRANEYIR